MTGILDKKDLEAKADAIVDRIHSYLDAGKKVFTTSSFQSQSLPLLHMISRVDRNIPVYYTNTGFLYPQTVRFADQLKQELGLNVIALRPETPKIKQLDKVTMVAPRNMVNRLRGCIFSPNKNNKNIIPTFEISPITWVCEINFKPNGPTIMPKIR